MSQFSASVAVTGVGGPYGLAIVELQEGRRMMTNIIDIAPDEAVIDMPVELVFEPRGDVGIPLFRPIRGE